MFMEYFCLENYIGIYQGTLLNKLEIDFRLCRNKIVAIRGDGGSGKSTLLRSFSMFPDPNKEILPGVQGRKSGIICDKGMRYMFQINYNWNKNKDERGNVECFIQKPTPEGYIELNSGGTVRSYYDVLETEFGIDPNFLALSFLSTEEKGIVEKTPAERKKMVGNKLEDVDLYNTLNKVYSKKANIYKSMLSNLNSKIMSIGSAESIKASLSNIEGQIVKGSNRRDTLINSLGKISNEISTLDPDGSIQHSKQNIIDEINITNIERNKVRGTLNYFATHEKHGLNNEELSNIDLAVTKLASIKSNIDKLNSDKTLLSSKLQDTLVKREEESKSIELKTQRLLSLQSECVYDNIEETIDKYRQMISSYEKIFNDIHIQNAISITKDEYITGLNTLKDIKDMIDAFRSFSYPYTIEEAIDAIRSSKDLMREFNELESIIASKTEEIRKLGEQYNYYKGLSDKLNALSLRPEDCNINTCPFIKDALEAQSKRPIEEMDRISIAIDLNEKDLSVAKSRYNDLNDVIQAVANLKIILRNIDNNKIIINKLPIAHIFLNREELFTRLINHSTFDEIIELYDSIKYANIFEEYKIAKDNLYKLEADYKIYASRNIIINELNDDINDLNNKLNEIANSIESINNDIFAYEQKIKDLTIIYDNTNKFINMIKNYNDINNKLSELQSRLDKVTSSMSKLDNALERKLNIELELDTLTKDLEPLMTKREQYNYQLDQLDEYTKEFEELSNKYTKVELAKRFSSTSKEGIQNRYIEAYMNDTRELSNEILRMFFGGRLELYPYDLSNGFRMPCYSYYCNMLKSDVSDCSRSEKAMATLAISIALMKQQSTSKYNILKLDEIDEGLDTQNKNAFFPSLRRIFDILDVEQCLISTHSDQLDFSQCDIIQLRRINQADDGDEGNYIFKL